MSELSLKAHQNTLLSIALRLLLRTERLETLTTVRATEWLKLKSSMLSQRRDLEHSLMPIRILTAIFGNNFKLRTITSQMRLIDKSLREILLLLPDSVLMMNLDKVLRTQLKSLELLALTLE